MLADVRADERLTPHRPKHSSDRPPPPLLRQTAHFSSSSVTACAALFAVQISSVTRSAPVYADVITADHADRTSDLRQFAPTCTIGQLYRRERRLESVSHGEEGEQQQKTPCKFELCQLYEATGEHGRPSSDSGGRPFSAAWNFQRVGVVPGRTVRSDGSCCGHVEPPAFADMNHLLRGADRWHARLYAGRCASPR